MGSNRALVCATLSIIVFLGLGCAVTDYLPSYLIFHFLFRTLLRTALSLAYITYLWNILAFSRDFHKVLSPSMTFCYLLQRSSSFRDSHVYILYL